MPIFDNFGRVVPERKQPETTGTKLRNRFTKARILLIAALVGLPVTISNWNSIKWFIHDSLYPSPYVGLGYFEKHTSQYIIYVNNVTRHPLHDVYISLLSTADTSVRQTSGVTWEVVPGPIEKRIANTKNRESLPLRSFYFRVTSLAPEEIAVFLVNTPIETNNFYINKVDAQTRNFLLFQIPRITTARTEIGPFRVEQVVDLKVKKLFHTDWIIEPVPTPSPQSSSRPKEPAKRGQGLNID
jgi:hypothetical protein